MRTVLTWSGITAGGLVGLAALALGGLVALGTSRTGRTVAVAHPVAPVVADSARVARGKQLAVGVSRCAACHGSDFGGQVFVDDGAFGTIAAPNLTPGGGTRTAADWERAVRHGVGADGRVLIGMPAEFYAAYSDADLEALVAYLGSLPPVERDLPTRSLGPLARALVGAGVYTPPALATDHAAPHPAEAPGTPAAYGAYLVAVAACGECHGAALTGPDLPGPPPGPDLTPAGRLGAWTEAEFVTALRSGQAPDKTLDPALMPWPRFAYLSDDDLRAVWAYLRTLPAEGAIVASR